MSQVGSRLPTRTGKRPATVVAIADGLREDIASGRLRSGERIKEIPLAARMGVSRGPVRDAIKLLAEEGLLELHANRGASVPTLRVDDVLEVYALRAALGSLAVHKLMIDPARLDLPPLRDLLERFRAAVDAADQADAVAADLAFQDEIVRLSGLRRAQRTFEQLSYQIRMFISSLGVVYDLAAIYNDVEMLFTAITAADLPLAERLWREKFERCMRDFLDYLPAGDLDPALWFALTQRPAGVR